MPLSACILTASATSSLTFHLLSLPAITARVNTHYWQPFSCLPFYFSPLLSPSSVFHLPSTTLRTPSLLTFFLLSSQSLSPVNLPLKGFPIDLMCSLPLQLSLLLLTFLFYGFRPERCPCFHKIQFDLPQNNFFFTDVYNKDEE